MLPFPDFYYYYFCMKSEWRNFGEVVRAPGMCNTGNGEIIGDVMFQAGLLYR